MKKLCIVGTGSQARYVIENLKNDTRSKVVGLVDLEKKENVGKRVNNVEIRCVFSDIKEYFNYQQVEVIVAYGNNLRKREVVEELIANNYRFATIINSDTYISSFVDIGQDCIINPHVTILPNSKIGEHVIIHSGCIIEHDNTIEDFVNIAPGVKTAGNVRIGEGSYICTGAIITPNIKIGKWSIVGAGAVVIREVAKNDIVAGVPAKSIKQKHEAEL